MVYPRKLVLVRHGQSEANIVQKGLHHPPEGFLRDTDVGRRLTKLGVWQAQMAGDWLRANDYVFSRQYVSPFVRAMETAVNLNISDEWLIDDLWRERDWGEYGLYSKEDQRKIFKDSTEMKDKFFWYWKPAGGESLATGVRSRVNSILTHMGRMEESEAILGVGHGELFSTFQFVIEKMTPQQWEEREDDPHFTIRNANIIEYSRVNPENPNDIRTFYKWGRVTNPWDASLSHYGGEWYELSSRRYTMEEMRLIIENSKQYFPGMDFDHDNHAVKSNKK